MIGSTCRGADLPVVGVVRRGDFQEAGGHLGFGVVLVATEGDGQDHITVFDDRDDPANQRQFDEQAPQRPRARITRVDGDGGVAEVRLGPRRSDGDVRLLVLGQVLGVWISLGGQLRPCHRRVVARLCLMHKRVTEVRKDALDLLVLDLVIGEGPSG